MSFKCGVCGKVHDTLPMDIAFRRPQDYFKVPEAQRARRIKINEDLCQIDDRIFIIRGYLPIPVHDSEQNFAWGVWVTIDRESFNRYLELWNVDGTNEPPFRGRLSASVPGYPETDGLETDVYLRTASERPLVRLRQSDHPFAQEQMNGITLERVHEILDAAMPGWNQQG